MKVLSIVNGALLLPPDSLKPSEELQKNTESKLIKAKEWLGTKYLLHPANQIKRINKKPVGRPALKKVG